MKPIFHIDAEDTFAVLHATYPVKHTHKCQFRNVPVRYFTQSSMGESVNGDAVLLSRVADVFREVFDQPKLVVKPTTSPNDLAAWDSVAQVKLVMALEETFGVEFDSEEVLGFSTAGAFIDSLKARGVSG